MPNILNQHDLIFKDECYQIVGCAMEVHRELGAGFLEAVYQEALILEFNNQGVPNRSQQEIDIYYKEKLLNKKYISDFICFEEIIVGLKTVEKLKSEHYAQVLNYLKATNCKLGLLINFGASSLEYKRIVR
jgi:GxxExxY protein